MRALAPLAFLVAVLAWASNGIVPARAEPVTVVDHGATGALPLEIAQAAERAAEPAARPQLQQRSLLGGRPQTAPAPPRATGVLDRAWLWLMQTQQKVHRALAVAVRDLKTESPVWAALVLGGLSFAYGVLHAAGPGHGKAVISSYVLANEKTVRRGIMLSFLAAAIQGLSALVVVGVLVLAMNATSMEIKSTEHWIETASWALVAAIGLWLVIGQARAILRSRQTDTAGMQEGHLQHAPVAHEHAARRATAHAQTDAHSHVHDHDCGCAHDHGQHAAHDHNQHHAAPTHDHAHSDRDLRDHHNHDHHNHDHNHADDHDCCGHSHIPSPQDLAGPLSWSKALAIAFSVGIRPCTGAILVLIFAISQGLLWAGVFATFAMAIGTAITVSVLASLALASRDLATRMAGGGSTWGRRVERTIGLVGALLVFGMGVAFFMASLSPQTPF